MDILITDQGDGGDVVMREAMVESGLDYATNNADIYPDNGIGTAVYVSLFTDWDWSDAIKDPSHVVPGAGGFEEALNAPVTLGSMEVVRQKAMAQLSWLKTKQVVSDLTLRVSNPSLGRIEVDIQATEPNSVGHRYKVLWDQQEQKLTGFIRGRG